MLWTTIYLNSQMRKDKIRKASQGVSPCKNVLVFLYSCHGWTEFMYCFFAIIFRQMFSACYWQFLRKKFEFYYSQNVGNWEISFEHVIFLVRGDDVYFLVPLYKKTLVVLIFVGLYMSTFPASGYFSSFVHDSFFPTLDDFFIFLTGQRRTIRSPHESDLHRWRTVNGTARMAG